MKVCTVCKVSKPESEFHVRKLKTKIAHATRCKECAHEYQREYVRKNGSSYVKKAYKLKNGRPEFPEPTPEESKALIARMHELNDGTRGLLSPEVYASYKEWRSKPENIARLVLADENRKKV